MKTKIGLLIRDILGDARYASLRHPKMVRRGFREYGSVFRGGRGAEEHFVVLSRAY